MNWVHQRNPGPLAISMGLRYGMNPGGLFCCKVSSTSWTGMCMESFNGCMSTTVLYCWWGMGQDGSCRSFHMSWFSSSKIAWEQIHGGRVVFGYCFCVVCVNLDAHINRILYRHPFTTSTQIVSLCSVFWWLLGVEALELGQLVVFLPAHATSMSTRLPIHRR